MANGITLQQILDLKSAIGTHANRRWEQLKLAVQLMELHLEQDPGIKHIWWFPHDVEVRLLEVSPYNPVCGVSPLSFCPTERFPHVSSIIGIHDSELGAVLIGDVKLPSGWDWNTAEPICTWESISDG